MDGWGGHSDFADEEDDSVSSRVDRDDYDYNGWSIYGYDEPRDRWSDHFERKKSSETQLLVKIPPWFRPDFHDLDFNDFILLGIGIGKSTCLKKLEVKVDSNTEYYHIGDEPTMIENPRAILEAFCAGLAHNRSVEFLKFDFFDFAEASLSTLHSLVVENQCLTDLRLCGTHVCNGDLGDLANAFSRRRNPTSIKSISLAGMSIFDESMGDVVRICNHCPSLERLDLAYNDIDYEGCRYLAAMLRNPNSSLKKLHLGRNELTPEGVRLLGSALAKNKSLMCLSVGGSWWWDGSGLDSYFVGIICNISSIKSTYESNHTLERMSQNCRIHLDNILSDELTSALRGNADKCKSTVVRRKIFQHHLSGNFNLDQFLNMERKLIPTVLGWIGRDHFTNSIGGSNQSRLTPFYRILCSFPDLCSHPSAERKIRLRLEAENAYLRRQNEQLLFEITRLRSNVYRFGLI